MSEQPDLTDGSALEALGYSPRWQALFEESRSLGDKLIPARVLRADRGMVFAAIPDGTVVKARPSATMVKGAVTALDLPAGGDWVALSPGDDLGVRQIETILERTSAITRGDPVENGAIQVLAANIDTVFVVHPIAERPNLRRLERELALAWESGATPVVVLTKADLSSGPEEAQEAVESVSIGVDVLVTSAKTGEGVEQLLAYAEGHRTVVLIGPSGAGKSTLVNALLGAEVQATAEVRVNDGSGRHTTVARELFPLPNGGVLIDTPGLRGIALTASAEGLASVFSDIEELSLECRFRDCTHTVESGCAVKAATKTGELSPDRLRSYLKLGGEVDAAVIKQEARKKAVADPKGRAPRKRPQRYRDDEDAAEYGEYGEYSEDD